MAKKLSSDPAHPEENIGAMLSGGTAGTFNRIGRGPADPPGPHALTSADNGTRQRVFDYNANGNMTNNDGDGYLYDFADRLGKVIKGSQDIRYLYDYTGRRVIRRVDGVQTTYISKLVEIRDGQMLNYVFAGEARLARVDGMISPPATVTQRIPLVEGWNLISFQVDPGTTDPAMVLSSIAGKYTAVYGWGGQAYVRYEHGATGNTLTEMLPNLGYWVLAIEATYLQTTGTVSSAPVGVLANTPTLVGMPGLRTRTAEDITGQSPAVESVWSYEASMSSWRCSSVLAPAFVESLLALHPGVGCWVTCSQDATIVFSVPPVPTAEFYHADHLGSTNTTSNAAGQPIARSTYYPFGTTRRAENIQRAFDPVYRFIGKEQDEESDLYHVDARFLSCGAGRFVTCDPLGEQVPERWLAFPSRFNSYLYGSGNPLAIKDTSGLEGNAFDVSASAGTATSSSYTAAVDNSRFSLKVGAGDSSVGKSLNEYLRTSSRNQQFDTSCVPFYLAIERKRSEMADRVVAKWDKKSGLEKLVFSAVPEVAEGFTPTGLVIDAALRVLNLSYLGVAVSGMKAMASAERSSDVVRAQAKSDALGVLLRGRTDLDTLNNSWRYMTGEKQFRAVTDAKYGGKLYYSPMGKQ